MREKRKINKLKYILSSIVMLIVAGYLVNLGIISRINKNIIAPSETNSDWKMYENAEYNVRFKYPQELSIKEDTDIAPNSWKIFLYEEGGTPHTLFSVQTKLKDEEVDDDYRSFMRQLVTFMLEDPRTISMSLEMIFVTKSLERIGDHAKNISEGVIYTVSGEDVRHEPIEKIIKTLNS